MFSICTYPCTVLLLAYQSRHVLSSRYYGCSWAIAVLTGQAEAFLSLARLLIQLIFRSRSRQRASPQIQVLNIFGRATSAQHTILVSHRAYQTGTCLSCTSCLLKTRFWATTQQSPEVVQISKDQSLSRSHRVTFGSSDTEVCELVIHRKWTFFFVVSIK